ncbi:histidine kinase [Actinoplanes sp. NPDC049548]|uniref:sensor histidine kinase n=1 Tax=Actinoplanes sp. NPDC049548 TaxID=3155152 RepID=UPI003444C749
MPAGLALTGGSIDTVITGTLAWILALLALLLRRWPVAVLIVSVCTVAALRGAELVGAGWVWPATAAFIAVMLAGRIRTAVITGAVTLGYGFVWDYFVEGSTFDHAVGRVGGEVLWLAAALGLAHAYRSTRRWQDEAAARLRQSLEQQELEARRRRAEERVDIARDLHDVVSHTLAVVGVHLNVALDAFDDEPQEARDAVRLAQDVRGRAMSDLRTLVDVLRFEGGEPAPGLDRLDDLVERVRFAGIDVHLKEQGDRASVPAPVATAVHRVVQEALTNTVRHSGATHATVTLTYGARDVVAEIVDNGNGGGEALEGHGATGQRDASEEATERYGIAGQPVGSAKAGERYGAAEPPGGGAESVQGQGVAGQPGRGAEAVERQSIAGQPDGAEAVEGHGIVGMRERVSALGGTLLAGPIASGGFAVRAMIPVVAGS